MGLGGIPFQKNNGGLPSTSITGISSFGSPGFYPAIEYENVFQILDNVTKVAGNHTLKAGVAFQHVRFSTTAPTNPHGAYTYNGFYTSIPGQSFTGSGVADFLADQQNNAGLSNYFNIDNVRWYNSGYFQDDWKIMPRLTLNLGIRYDYYQPTQERHDNQANWYPTAINGPGSGTGELCTGRQQAQRPLAPTFLNLIAQNNINLMYTRQSVTGGLADTPTSARAWASPTVPPIALWCAAASACSMAAWRALAARRIRASTILSPSPPASPRRAAAPPRMSAPPMA